MGRALQFHIQGSKRQEGLEASTEGTQSARVILERRQGVVLHRVVWNRRPGKVTGHEFLTLPICLFQDSLQQHPGHYGAGMQSLRLCVVCPEVAQARRKKSKGSVYRQSWIQVCGV